MDDARGHGAQDKKAEPIKNPAFVALNSFIV